MPRLISTLLRPRRSMWLGLLAGIVAFGFASCGSSGGGGGSSSGGGAGSSSSSSSSSSGGTATTYTIGGTVSGLSASGLVLQDDGGSNLSVSSGATVFTFATALASGSAYAVTVQTQPTGMTCNVTNGSGTVSAVNVTSVSVACAAVAPVFTTFQVASVVIGQSAPTTAATGTSLASLNLPAQVTYDGTTLWVPDYNNNRVLAFSGIPTSNGTSASFSFTQGNPVAVGETGSGLYVSTAGSNRVDVYSPVPISSSPIKTASVGQTVLNGNSIACANPGLSGPQGFVISGNVLVAADQNNQRVLIWHSIPTTNTPADLVLGQGDFTHCAANDDLQTGIQGTAPTNRTMYNPTGVWTDGTRLAVADNNNNRVMLWNTFPTQNFQPADVILGQGSPTTRALAITQAGMWGPTGVYIDSAQLIVADRFANRVLIWNSVPTTQDALPDVVLGQGDFIHGNANDDSQSNVDGANPTGRTLWWPNYVYKVGKQLLVSDSENNRVLIYQGQ